MYSDVLDRAFRRHQAETLALAAVAAEPAVSHVAGFKSLRW